MERRKVVVIGAGYAGTIAANRLVRAARDIDVTVVNPRPDFVHRIRLHELIAGAAVATEPLARMLDPRVHLTVGTAETIGDGVVNLADGTRVPFNYVLYAAGGAVSAPAGTLAVGEVDSAVRARTALLAVPDGGVVTVVGGGLTGIETAAEVAHSRPGVRVDLVSAGEVGASLSAAARRRVAAELADLGVRVRIEKYSGQGDSDLVLWAIATSVSDLAARSGLAVDERGRVLVDQSLRSTADPRIIAVGDAAAVPGTRMSCQAALPQGVHGANTVLRLVEHKEPKPFSMSFTSQNVSLGRSRAIVQVTHRDDSPARLYLRGGIAAVVKETVCRMTRVVCRTGRYAWLPGPR